MSIDFFYPETPAETGISEKPTKADLVGEVIVVTTTGYDGAAPSSFGDGTTQEWTGNLVCAGPKYAGQVFDDYKLWGNIARNLGQVPAGRTAVVKFIQGKGQQGRSFYGADICHPKGPEAILAQQVLDGLAGKKAGEGFPF